MNRNDVLTDEEDELLECCEYAWMVNVIDEYYYFDRDILERYIRDYKFELIKFTTYYKNRNEILSGLVKKKGYVYEFDIAQDTGKISIRTRGKGTSDSKKVKDSKLLKRTHKNNKIIEKVCVKRSKRDDLDKDIKNINDTFDEIDYDIYQILNLIDKLPIRTSLNNIDEIIDFIENNGRKDINTLSTYLTDEEAIKRLEEMKEFIEALKEAELNYIY